MIANKIIPIIIIALTILAACGQPRPQDYAEADRIRQESADRAAAAAAARAADSAEAAASLPAIAARNTLAGVGLGLAAFILSITGSLALGAWLHRRAASVFPNEAGQYPLLIERTRAGEIIIHDANRAVNPTLLISPANATPRAITAPITADSAAQAQITTQAQAHQLLIAGTRGTANTPAATREIAETISQNAFRSGSGLPRMPDVRIVADPQRENNLTRLLAGTEVDDDYDHNH